ncbi:acyl carrier protein [Pseudomonas wadenswilerensis]
MATINDRVLNIVAEAANLDKLPDPKLRMIEDLGFDSLDLVELQAKLESEFDVSLPDETYSNFTTVAQLVTWIKAHGQ